MPFAALCPFASSSRYSRRGIAIVLAGQVQSHQGRNFRTVPMGSKNCSPLRLAHLILCLPARPWAFCPTSNTRLPRRQAKNPLRLNVCISVSLRPPSSYAGTPRAPIRLAETSASSTYVSSDSTRPSDRPACAVKRCRQQDPVVTATPHRCADRRTDSRSTNERPIASRRCV